MKAFAAFVCLVAVVVAQASASEIPAQAKADVDCDLSSEENGWPTLVPNPVDCGSYYVCNGGIPILMHCPDGLHFNPKISVCDWPDVVNCKVI